nr:hypothetical protein [Tanacetum cinerariifolium]
DPVDTPMVEKSKLDEDKEGKAVDPSHYRGLWQPQSTNRAFQVTADVPEIYMQEFWATNKLHHNSIRFKIDTKKSVLDLEAFREMLHISPRIPNQSFVELPSEEEIIEFLRNSKAYKEYYACATGEAAPKPKASARKKKVDSASSTTPPTPTPTTTVMIMATTIDQQVALDEALVPSMQRLRIGRSNFRLPFDIQSKESTLQVVYDFPRNSPFFRAFQVTADVPKIYMQEFCATAKLHHNSIRFKMDTKKSVLDLEAFREMLHTSLRILSQSFAELPSEEEILEFLRNL